MVIDSAGQNQCWGKFMGQVISVDLGGTWMRAALVSSEGTCAEVVRVRTDHHRPGKAILADLLGIIDDIRSRNPGASADIKAVVSGIPTTLDEGGGLAPSENLPTLTGFPLARHLEQALHLPVMLLNDANCFTMGEWWQGMGKGARNFCGVTLGTGIGMGLVFAGKLYQGSHGCAGEIWKSPWETGRLEQRACGQALEAAYEANSGNRLSGEDVARLAEQGDACAVKCYVEFGTALGRILAFVINLIDPEAVAIGGAMAASFAFFRESLMEAVMDGTVAGMRVRVAPSLLGERAALLGAGKIYWDRRESNDKET